LDYARNGIKPRCMRMQEALNSNFVNRFDERLFLAFDDPVPADERAQIDRLKTLVNVGIMSENEARAELGLPPVEGGDEILVPNNRVPLAHVLRTPDPRIIPPNGPARPEEIPDDAQEPSESFNDDSSESDTGDDHHDGAVDESGDEPFEEGDDI